MKTSWATIAETAYIQVRSRIGEADPERLQPDNLPRVTASVADIAGRR
ncbi:hypothetical protein [Actinoplanes sp. NPDC051851]